MEYKLSNTVSLNGTSLLGYINANYNDLCSKIGLPNSEGDKYKVSTEWIFEDEDGNGIALYDYKKTNLYDPEYMLVEEFRNLESYEWHIGAKNKFIAINFKKWLEDKLNEVDCKYQIGDFVRFKNENMEFQVGEVTDIKKYDDGDFKIEVDGGWTFPEKVLLAYDGKFKTNQYVKILDPISEIVVDGQIESSVTKENDGEWYYNVHYHDPSDFNVDSEDVWVEISEKELLEFNELK